MTARFASAERTAPVFDEALTRNLNTTSYERYLLKNPLMLKHLSQVVWRKNLVTDAAISYDLPEDEIENELPTTFSERKYSAVVNLLKVFAGFAQEFSSDRDETFANIDDFRAVYERRVSKQLPGLFYHAEGFRSTTVIQNYKSVTMGGGGGFRLDLTPTENGTFSIALLPLYGEKRRMGALYLSSPYGSDQIQRVSGGVEYKHKLSSYVEPGAQFFFQPQLLDFEQFRVYAETYIKFKFVQVAHSSRKELKVAEISLVPKVVYWKTTDESGLWGDSLKDIFGPKYDELSSHLYAFLTLELRFRM